MQILKISPGKLTSIVHVPSSKSYANRALIIGSLQKHSVTLKHLPTATDVTILIDCLKQIGLDVNDGVISNSFPECETSGKTLDVGEGGTTARFLATMLLLGKQKYRLILGERLKQRPWKEFIEVACSLGAEVTLEDNILSVKGPIEVPTRLEVDCSKTTQFATAFQMIFPKKTVVPVHLQTSESYWKMTEKIITDLGNNSVYSVPLDWSSASYPLAFGALNQEIDFPGLKFDPFQADAKFFNILQKFFSIAETPSGISVFPGPRSGNLKFNVSDALDLVPALAYYLAHVEGTHELLGIENLVHKESDRLNEVIKLLHQFERSAEVRGHSLLIIGHSKTVTEPKELIMPNDHRMVMTATLFLLHHAGGTVSPAEAVSKSYPDFFRLLLNH